MTYANLTIPDFIDALGSKDPAPGGGGASALLGAIGASLASMVGNLTIGKPKHADVEEDAKALVAEAQELSDELIRLIDADAEAFEPLAKAYRITKDDPNRDEVMEACLKDACEVPLEIMRACARAIDIHERMSRIGANLAISDVGVGIASCKAALQCASLNVFVNTRLMKERCSAQRIDHEADELLDAYVPKAEEIFDSVCTRIKGV